MEDLNNKLETAFDQNISKVEHDGDKAYFKNKWNTAEGIVQKHRILALLRDYIR